MFAVGEVVGQTYRIVRLIGEGGMGEVYEAIHEPLSRRVAIKTMRPTLSNESDSIERFRREAEASAALGHPNIVQVTDFIIDPGRPSVMVMELLEGRTLRELLSSAKKLEHQRAVFIALQILSGLAAAHRAGIIHRDVKPGNVFLQKTLAIRDHVKLLDFGVAKLIEQDTKNTPPLTERGIVVGTRAYMAPEQELGGTVDARSDLYAVGATLYYALSGWRPRETSEPLKEVLPLNRVAGHIPKKLCAIVDQALSVRPEDRHASAEAMGQELAAFSSTIAGFGAQTHSPNPANSSDQADGAEESTTEPEESTTEPEEPTAEPDATTRAEAPMTVRDERFGHDVLDSAAMTVKAPITLASETNRDEVAETTDSPTATSGPPAPLPFQVSTKRMHTVARPTPRRSDEPPPFEPPMRPTPSIPATIPPKASRYALGIVIAVVVLGLLAILASRFHGSS